MSVATVRKQVEDPEAGPPPLGCRAAACPTGDSSVCHVCQGWIGPGISKFSCLRDSSRSQPSSRTLSGERQLMSVRSVQKRCHMCWPRSVSISEGGYEEAAVPFLLPWGEPLAHLYIGPGRFKGRSYPCLQFNGSSSKSFLLHKPVFLYKALHCIYPPVPGQESPLRWAGKKFEEVPIAHIKASYNNTQIQVVSAANKPLARTSCGTEGFKNAKKGTGIAAQTAGIAAAAKATAKGVTHIRVVVKGLGPGRLSAIQGLTMGGLEVISITDNTPIPHNGCRPRKARRL